MLWVKGSGADLADVTAAGFAPVDLAGARRLLALPALSDTALLRELRLLRLDPDAPTPSCEALLHAFLPARFIDHTHADSVARGARLALRQAAGGGALGRRPPDRALRQARLRSRPAGARASGSRPATAAARWTGIVLENHGIFTFGATARESYERMLASVERARKRLPASGRVASPIRAAARPADSRGQLDEPRCRGAALRGLDARGTAADRAPRRRAPRRAPRSPTPASVAPPRAVRSPPTTPCAPSHGRSA